MCHSVILEEWQQFHVRETQRERQQLKGEKGRATLVEEKKKECIPLWRLSLFVLATRWLREFRIFSVLFNSLFECELE
jgi:hypothetical protein